MRTKGLLYAVIFALIAAGCARASYEGAGIENAANFRIEYLAGGAKIVTDSEGRELLLLPRGAKIPEKYRDMPKVRIPVQKAFCTSATQISFIGRFEDPSLYDTICAVSAPIGDWTVPEIAGRMARGKIKYIEMTHDRGANMESVVDLQPDIVFSSAGDAASAKMHEQMANAGINYVSMLDYKEANDGAFLEWIKLYGAFYNRDGEADRIYREVSAKLSALAEKAAKISTGTGTSVALGLLFNGVVYTQGGESNFRRNVERAGGSYALAGLNAKGDIQIGMEKFFAQCRSADVLIYSSAEQYVPSLEALKEQHPLMQELKAVKDGRVYVYNKGYYMNAALLDEKFEDLVAIITPGAMPEGYELKHFKLLK